MGLLSLSIWLPIAFGAVLLAIGRDSNPGMARALALLGAVLSFLVTIPLITGFDTASAALQFSENLMWIERFNVRYHLGVDGISVWFVLLTAFITIVVVLAGWEVITERVHQYMGAFLILSGLMVGVFAAADGLLFYVFFEATLIPMYIIIGVWGGPRRVYAAFKFFLYTLAGSLLMLVALVYLYYKSGGSFDIATWHKLPLGMHAQALLFFAFFAAFSVKVPMWPVHTWLPDAHVEAPTGGSVVLAAIMLKLGAYGFLRFSMPIAPDASREYAWFIIALSLIAVIYIGLVALVQQDMKKLVAYSSIAHDPELLVLDEPLNGLDPLVRAETIDLFRSWAAEGKHVILSSHVLQEVDVISDQVVLIANGMIVAEGRIRKVRDEIEERPSQFLIRCRGTSHVAALLFGEDHVTEIKLVDDGFGMLVKTRDRERFARALGRIALDGHKVESVVPADENVDALYEYLIGGE